MHWLTTLSDPRNRDIDPHDMTKNIPEIIASIIAEIRAVTPIGALHNRDLIKLRALCDHIEQQEKEHRLELAQLREGHITGHLELVKERDELREDALALSKENGKLRAQAVTLEGNCSAWNHVAREREIERNALRAEGAALREELANIDAELFAGWHHTGTTRSREIRVVMENSEERGKQLTALRADYDRAMTLAGALANERDRFKGELFAARDTIESQAALVDTINRQNRELAELRAVVGDKGRCPP